MHSTPFIAYIDPGSGSLIFQVLAAMLMGLVVAFRSVRLWLSDMSYRLLGKTPPGIEEDASSDGDSEDSADSDSASEEMDAAVKGPTVAAMAAGHEPVDESKPNHE